MLRSRDAVKHVFSAERCRAVLIRTAHREHVVSTTRRDFLASLTKLVQVHILVAFLYSVVFCRHIFGLLEADRLQFVRFLLRGGAASHGT